MSLVSVLRSETGSLADLHVYELSSRGPLVDWLKRNADRVTGSEFFDGVASGTMVNGIQCQDVQKLTHADASFDVCTSTEVFEHVPDDSRGLAEIHRVLRPRGRLILSVPLTTRDKTVERAILGDGAIRHLLPPEYHGDRIRGWGGVLAYRNYGLDIIERVRSAGFSDVRFVRPKHQLGRWEQMIVVGTA
jgi:SAM-dependent methyltransferase